MVTVVFALGVAEKSYCRDAGWPRANDKEYVHACYSDIPHLFGGSNRFPTGQRGLYLWWRNSSQVLSPALQANSAFVSLKVL